MHGRVKKDVVVPSAEEKAKQREQVRTARGLFGKLLELRGSKVYNEQALEMTSKALQFHPEFPTLWGYRRELLTNMETPLKELLKGEMKLLEKALRKSQKVYSIWFHRKWVVERLFEEAEESTIRELLDKELELCNELLAVDERDFHCWNHRMFLMDLMRSWMKGKEEVDLNAIDLKLSTDLINKNFSNYSAWHLRTLLHQSLGGEEPRMKLNLDEELEWVQQGVYTEPNDQSVWLYHQWLTLRDGEPRITHCAKMGGELFIFFSQAVSASTVQLMGRDGQLEALPGRGGRTRRAASSWGLAFCASVALEAPEVELTVDGRWTFRGRLRDVDLQTEGDRHEARAPEAPVVSELARVEELLEIEPECRWALLARARLGQAVGRPAEEEVLERLSGLDPLRRHFYGDARAQLLLERELQRWRLSEPLELQCLGLRQLKASCVASIFGVSVLKLDENDLQELQPLLLLLSLTELSVAKNRLSGHVAEIFALKRLRRVDLSSNCLKLGHGEPPSQLLEIDMTQNHFEASKALELLPEAQRSSWTLKLDAASCVALRAS